MPATRGERAHRAAGLAELAVAAAYAGWASGTVPFGAVSYLAVSLPSALFLGGLVLERAAPERAPWRHHRVADVPASPTGTIVPWVVLVAVVGAAELASYFHGGPRSLYPTISSATDTLFRTQALKAAAFFGWLVGGWYLVTR